MAMVIVVMMPTVMMMMDGDGDDSYGDDGDGVVMVYGGDDSVKIFMCVLFMIATIEFWFVGPHCVLSRRC